MPDRWMMGNLARRDQYVLPITGGLEQQALARMPAISMNVEDRRPTGPHSFQAQEPVIAMQKIERDMTFGQPDKYGFSQSLDESLQGSPPMPHPLQATPVDKFADYLTGREISDATQRHAETQERKWAEAMAGDDAKLDSLMRDLAANSRQSVPSNDEWRQMREQYDANPNAYGDPETGTN
jgi:hypothetical protein